MFALSRKQEVSRVVNTRLDANKQIVTNWIRFHRNPVNQRVAFGSSAEDVPE